MTAFEPVTRVHERGELDVPAAVTRSMLGWGVLAGPIYVGVGLSLALTRDGFHLTQHSLSLLMLGELGWLQRINLLLSGVLVLIAAVGIRRALAYARRPTRAGALVTVVGIGLLGGGIFAPDPMAGFPAGAQEAVSASGILHMVLGAVQFVCLSSAAFSLARWTAARDRRDISRASRVIATTILLGFFLGAALGHTTTGVVLIWIAVLAGYAWLALACIHLWGVVPHPDMPLRRTSSRPASH
jgi:hypothetical protein